MPANNQGISHYGPKGRPLCGRMTGHILIRELDRFMVARKPCKTCSAILSTVQAVIKRSEKSSAQAQAELNECTGQCEECGVDVTMNVRWCEDCAPGHIAEGEVNLVPEVRRG